MDNNNQFQQRFNKASTELNKELSVGFVPSAISILSASMKAYKDLANSIISKLERVVKIQKGAIDNLGISNSILTVENGDLKKENAFLKKKIDNLNLSNNYLKSILGPDSMNSYQNFIQNYVPVVEEKIKDTSNLKQDNNTQTGDPANTTESTNQTQENKEVPVQENQDKTKDLFEGMAENHTHTKEEIISGLVCGFLSNLKDVEFDNGSSLKFIRPSTSIEIFVKAEKIDENKKS